jgi:hypothetical protein
MKKQVLNLVNELKTNNQDFEWYPTSQEMIDCVINDKDFSFDLLDIGAGDGRFIEAVEKARLQKIKDAGVSEYGRDNLHIDKSYNVIEKSQILLSKLWSIGNIVGADFWQANLMTKNVDIIFCNPPYSEFVEWVCKILNESCCNFVYLIIPQRWVDNIEIKQIIEQRNFKYDIIYTGDFLEADRQARSKINIVKFDLRREKVKSCGGSYVEKMKSDPFANWFESFFEVKIKNNKKEWNQERQEREEKESKFRSDIANSEDKIQFLIDCYNQDRQDLLETVKCLSDLSKKQIILDCFKEFNVNIEAVYDNFKKELDNISWKYWRELFNCYDKITNKLTEKSRSCLLSTIKEKGSGIEFNRENIYAITLWVINNVNKYHDSQIIDLFLKLSSEFNNVRAYKCNQWTWKDENWRYSRPDDATHYSLEYRIKFYFGTCIYSTYNRNNKIDDYFNLLQEIAVVASQFGFENNHYCRVLERGLYEKQYIGHYEKPLATLRYFKNGNIDIAFDKQFIKALNIEASRLLGWVKDWSDLKDNIDDIQEEDKKYYHCNDAVAINIEHTKLLNL